MKAEGASIQSRLLRAIVVTQVVAGLLAGTLTYLLVRAELLRQLDKSLKTQAGLITALVSCDEGKIELDPLPPDLTQFGAKSRGGYFEISTDDGVRVIASANLPGSTRPELLVDPLQGNEGEAAVDCRLPSGRPGRGVSRWFTPHDESTTQPVAAKILRLVVAVDREPVDESIGQVATLFAISVAVMTLVVVLVARWLIGRQLQPLRAMAATAQQITPTTLETRLPTHGLPAELTPIAQRLNELLQRLQTAFAAEQRFTASIAHELRTPVAELRSLADVAARWPEDAAAQRQLSAGAPEVAARMTRMVETLLAVARGKSLVANPGPVDLAALIRQRVAVVVVADKPRPILQLPESLTLSTDAGLLTPLLDNLLANAIEYVTVAGGVAIELTTGPLPRLVIENDCAALSESQLAVISEPFWRADESRTGMQHLGLGLTMVNLYAAALGVSVGITLPTPTRFRVEVRWA